jgi:hypothetical protein
MLRPGLEAARVYPQGIQIPLIADSPPPAELSSELTNQDRGPYEQDRSPEKSSHTSLLRPFSG